MSNEMLSEKEALVVIGELKKANLGYKVTKVDTDGFIVKADVMPVMDEEVKSEDEVVDPMAMKEEDAKTALPEDKSKGTADKLAQQEAIVAPYEQVAEEEMEAPMDEEVKEDVADVMEKAIDDQMKDDADEAVSEDELHDEEDAQKIAAKLITAKVTFSIRPVKRKFAFAIADEDMEKAEEAVSGDDCEEEVVDEEIK